MHRADEIPAIESAELKFTAKNQDAITAVSTFMYRFIVYLFIDPDNNSTGFCS